MTIIRTSLPVFLFSAALLGLSASAGATPLVQITTVDHFYSSFSGSLDSSATGSADTLTWSSSGYGVNLTIDFTNGDGIITDVLSTAFNDSYLFSGFLSGNAAIGSQCVAGGNTVCLVTTGLTQDLTPFVNEFNGGNGLYLGGNISVVVNDAPVPEPASLTLFGAGLAGLGWLRRRVRLGAQPS